jgi:hypothetical protein
MTIHEPAALRTDYLFKLLEGYFAWRLLGRASVETLELVLQRIRSQ